MSITQNITADNKWFIGEDKILEFEVLSDDGLLSTDPAKGVEDVSTWDLVFWLAKSVTSSTPLFPEKRTGGLGITIVGIYNSSRSVNTQRIRITIIDDDTDTLKAGTYYLGLKRLAPAGDAVLVDGSVVLQKAPVPAA